jgi:hypothetical protein|nr:MAG TPA: hypothetical protein [Caudoviricetes sp.]
MNELLNNICCYDRLKSGVCECFHKQEYLDHLDDEAEREACYKEEVDKMEPKNYRMSTGEFNALSAQKYFSYYGNDRLRYNFRKFKL